jgi:hypothetical protein
MAELMPALFDTTTPQITTVAACSTGTSATPNFPPR